MKSRPVNSDVSRTDDESSIPPPAPLRFIGRKSELSTLHEWLGASPTGLITVTGMGGIGKSTLVARFLAERYPARRVAWLSVYEDPSLARLEAQIARFAKNKPEVVVLDDVERLSPDVLQQSLNRIQVILPAVPVIATSRESIRLLAGRTLFLKALSTEEAVTLLREKLGEAGDQELAALALRLGNHPLALSIASALGRRLELPVSELIEQLDTTIYELESQISQPPATTIQLAAPTIVLAGDALVARIQRQPPDIHQLTGRQFEEMVASLMENMGWEVHLTKQTRDGGRDILAYLETPIGRLLCLVEAKRYRPDRPVGVELVRALYGTLSHEQANLAMLVTTSHFTRDAREFQSKHVYQLALKEFDDVMTWIDKYRSGRRHNNSLDASRGGL